MSKLLADLPLLKRAIGFAYTIALFAIFFMNGSFDGVWQWLVALPFLALFFLWALIPIWMPLIFKPKMVLNGLAVGALAAYSIYVYWSSLLGPDVSSTAALIFMFLPLYQSAVGVGILLLGLAESFVRDRLYDD